MAGFLPEYEQQLTDARVKFAHSINALTTQSTPQDLAFFLLNYCALGATMNKPIESWIKKASKHCQKLNYLELANYLQQHAQQSTHHQALLRHDTQALTHWLNKKYQLNLDSQHYLKQKATTGIKQYQKLREQHAKGATPYCQLAIDYEVERLSIVHGFTLVKLCACKLGLPILKNLSFIRENVKREAGEHQASQQQMQKFLKANPQKLMPLVEAAKTALDAYHYYLQDCLIKAKNDCRQYLTPATTR